MKRLTLKLKERNGEMVEKRWKLSAIVNSEMKRKEPVIRSNSKPDLSRYVNKLHFYVMNQQEAESLR